MNILLVDPPFHRLLGGLRYYYPLGLAYLAAVVKSYGHEARIYDAELTEHLPSRTWLDTAGNYDSYIAALHDDEHPVWKECRAIVDDFRPQVVGISALSVKSPAALKIARLCKAVDPAITIVVGADHATACPEEFLKQPEIDFVIRGEGEYAFAKLVNDLDGKEKNYGCIEGLSFRRNGGMTHNPQAFIACLDELPLPLRGALWNPDGYRPLDYGLMVTSRGCHHHCTFCGVATVWGRKVRYRSVEMVLQEMEELYSTYGTDYFSFRDPSFTLDRGRILDLCRGLTTGRHGFRWECLTRADLLDDELVEKMQAAGCDLIRIGVESGSEMILSYLGKGCTLDQIHDGIGILRRHGMRWSAYFMFGVPLETRETLLESRRLMAELDPDFITIARFTPIPGTALYRDVVRRGLLKEPWDWRLECNQNLKTCFVENMSPEEFREQMSEMAEFADAHNQRHGWTDRRWS